MFEMNGMARAVTAVMAVTNNPSGLARTTRVKVLTTTAIRLNLMDAVNPRAATRENALDKFKTTRVTPPPMEATRPMAATNAAALTMLFGFSVTCSQTIGPCP